VFVSLFFFPARIILYIGSDFMNFSALPKFHFTNIFRVQKTAYLSSKIPNEREEKHSESFDSVLRTLEL